MASYLASNLPENCIYQYRTSESRYRQSWKSRRSVNIVGRSLSDPAFPHANSPAVYKNNTPTLLFTSSSVGTCFPSTPKTHSCPCTPPQIWLDSCLVLLYMMLWLGLSAGRWQHSVWACPLSMPVNSLSLQLHDLTLASNCGNVPILKTRKHTHTHTSQGILIDGYSCAVWLYHHPTLHQDNDKLYMKSKRFWKYFFCHFHCICSGIWHILENRHYIQLLLVDICFHLPVFAHSSRP